MNDKQTQTRASTIVPIAQSMRMFGVLEFSEAVEHAKALLQHDLSDTGLVLVGKAVIEGIDFGSRVIRLSWKVFNRPYPIEEEDCA